MDPWFIVASAPEDTPLIRAARGVNDGRPGRVVAHRQFQRLPRELFTRPSVIDPVGLLVGR